MADTHKMPKMRVFAQLSLRYEYSYHLAQDSPWSTHPIRQASGEKSVDRRNVIFRQKDRHHF